MKKPNIKKLKYPLWFQIVFLLFTVAVPIITLVIQGLNSPSKVFRISFTLLCTALISWIFVYKFVIKGIEEKLEKRKVSLEHDYEIDVGNNEKCKWLWFSNELILAIINAIHVLLIGSLIFLIVIGIQEAALKIKGAALLIIILYLLAYISKFVIILALRGKEAEEVNDATRE